jgi:hypothetical protein
MNNYLIEVIGVGLLYQNGTKIAETFSLEEAQKFCIGAKWFTCNVLDTNRNVLETYARGEFVDPNIHVADEEPLTGAIYQIWYGYYCKYVLNENGEPRKFTLMQAREFIMSDPVDNHGYCVHIVYPTGLNREIYYKKKLIDVRGPIQRIGGEYKHIEPIGVVLRTLGE